MDWFKTSMFVLISFILLFPGVGLAEDADPQLQRERAEVHFAAALAASEEGRFEDALSELEKASAAHADPLYLYHRVLVLERMKRPEIALNLLRERREEISRHPDISDVAVVEARLEAALEKEEPDEVVAPIPPSTSGPDVIAWTLIGGGVLVGGASIALLAFAQSDATNLRCSAFSDRSGCPAEVAYPDLTPEEFEDVRNRIRTMRIVGGVTAVAGVSMIGVGVYRLLSADVEEDGPGLEVSADRIGLYWRGSF